MFLTKISRMLFKFAEFEPRFTKHKSIQYNVSWYNSEAANCPFGKYFPQRND